MERIKTERSFYVIDYILILLAVISFAAQFSFMKIYENGVKQTNVTVLILLIVSNLAAASRFR